MYTVARLISRGVYTVSGPFHPFGGAVDIIVVEQPDGSYKSSPWYVRFGKFQGVLKTREKVVNIDVNGIDSDFHMYLDHKGEAFFLCDVKEDDENLIFTSPLSSGEEEINDNVNNSNQLVTESSIQSHTSDSLSVQEEFKGDVNLLPRTNSRRYRLLRYVFGRRASMGQEIGSSGDGSIARLDSLEEAQIAADLLEVNWSSSLPTTEVSNSSFNLLESNENDDETAVIFDLQNSNLGEIDAKPSLESEQISRECSDAIGDSLHEEGSQSERVSSYTDCETPDSFTLGEEKNQFYCETVELISEVSSKRVSRVLLINEDTEHDLGNCNIQINEIGSGKNVTFMDSNAENIRNASPSLVNMHMLTAESVEPGRMQVTELNKVPERLVGEKKLESDVHEEFANQSSMTKSSHSHTSTSNAFHLQGSAVTPEPQAQVVTTDKFISLAEDRELAENSDEEQFLFSDIDQLESSSVHCKDPISSNSMETETNPVTSTKDILKDHDSSLSLNTFVREQPPLSSQSEFKESRTTSSAQSIPSGRGGPSEEVAQSIPSGRRGPSEEVEWMMESLPNIRSGIDNLDVSDVHPLSCSLDSGSESLGWKLFRKDSSKPFTSDIDTDNFLKESSNTCNLEELKRMSSIPEIEISLCKHLLYEGMGIDAASQAFDDEKVDPENFIAVASAPLNSDKLVVRMGGRYFPWDAAVPVISGMTSFGHELTFDPEGMIAVERTEETLEGKSPRSIVASGGSWRLWPFSSRQSRTIGSVDPGLDGTKCEGTDNASESSNYVSPDRNVQQVKVTTKKVKSIVPTSEQLASLHLKEGQNVIKFTFSTAMLGKQQVDARIFLWKYDARIVVSDVDGTITKSDVLGQFMPLVGKDWSQTGVAHLFSAIKENGYKFIYLSARSVSQAYLTRQFLINLKQDGKALPDGPVVISPDGLFPSLYREVIRRAPHEFKIGCLEDIKALFPPDSNPFYAGFGNRDTDEFSYLKVGVPKGKIFTINPKGEVAVHRRVDTKSYTSLHELVNGMFPAMCSAGQEEFNQWNFWKVPPLYIDC